MKFVSLQRAYKDHDILRTVIVEGGAYPVSSGSATPREVMSERLAELRDETLLPGENTVAQQMGDHGQGVVVTDSRVMILKAGLSATGSINGQNVTAFLFDEIGIVNLRRGPMGAIIQIIGKEVVPNSGVRPPENMAVFSGEQKVKRLEIIVEKIIATGSITINRVEWIPDVVSDSDHQNNGLPYLESESTPVVDETGQISHCVPNELDSPLVAKKPRVPRKKSVPKLVAATADLESEEPEATELVPEAEKNIVMAESFESIQAVAEDKPVETISPDTQCELAEEPEIPVAPRGVQRLSLAEEIFAELSAEEIDVPVTSASEKVEMSDPKLTPVQIQPELDLPKLAPVFSETAVPAYQLTVEEYGPNPRLSKYMRKKRPRAGGVVALFIVLGIMVLAGLAITGRNSINLVVPKKPVDSRKDISSLKLKLSDLCNYKTHLLDLVEQSNIQSHRMEQALMARDAQAIRGTVSVESHDRALSELRKLKPPMGLRTVQTSLESAVTERKTVATAISNALTGASIVDPGKNDQRLKMANKKIQSAFGKIGLHEKSIRKQIDL